MQQEKHCPEHSGLIAISSALLSDMKEVKEDIKKLLYKIGLLVAGTTALNMVVTIVLPQFFKG